MILVFDVETTGLVNTREVPSHHSQPHLVQLGALLIEDDGRERDAISVIVQPDGWEVPAEAARVHGITTEIATAAGVPLLHVMALLSQLIRRSTVQVAHNTDFDVKCILAAAAHLRRELPPLNPRCTKDLATPVLNLPPTNRMIAAGFDKPKPPTLAECVRFFFDEDLPGAHDALVDARACARVYLELQRRRT